MTPKKPLLGLGNDILAISRMRQSIERHGQHLLNRLFTEKEQNYCLKHHDSAPFFAGRFTAKEAVVKAFGTGFGHEISWHDVEILNDERGKPFVLLSAGVQEKFQQPQLLISISHCEEYATAVAIWL